MSSTENDPVNAWTAYWNHRVDREAASAQKMRGDSFLQAWEKVCEAHGTQVDQLLKLQQFHLTISDLRLQAEPDVEEDEGEASDTMREWWLAKESDALAAWQENISDEIRHELSRSHLVTVCGAEFCREMLTWLRQQAHGENAKVLQVSWLELAMIWLKRDADKLPIPDVTGGWKDNPRASAHTGSMNTVAATMQLFHRFFRLGLS